MKSRIETVEQEERTAATLATIAVPPRVRMLSFLATPRSASEVSRRFALSRALAERHLDALSLHGLVEPLPGGPDDEGAFRTVARRVFELGLAVGDLARGAPDLHGARRPSDRTVGVAGYAGPRRGAPAGPVASGTYQLLALTGPAIGVVFALSEGRTRWTIGRAKDRDVPLELDPFVSGAHAEIQLAAPGPELVDVFSSNGTHLNFAKIPRGGRVPLRVGDVVNVGRTHLVLQLG